MDVKEFAVRTIGLAIERQDFEYVAKVNSLEIEFMDNTESMIRENINALSQAQRVVLFSYIYLYYAISNNNKSEDKIFWILDTLSLSRRLVKNCSEILTEERVNYIKNSFDSRTEMLSGLFHNVDEHINNVITEIAAMPLPEDKKTLTGLNSREYEHLVDKKALEKLQLNPALEKIIKTISEYDVERLLKIQYTGSLIKVTKTNIPYLYDILEEACRILDINDIPDIYLEQGFINGYTIGINEPIIVLSNAVLSLLTYDELLFLIGHELGHIKSQHVLYHSVGRYLPYIGNFIGNLTLGIGDVLSSGLELAIYNWQRMSEFTADRAGLLVCQNVEAAISVMCKIAGYPISYYGSLDTKEFLKQAQAFEDFDSSKYNKALKILSAAYTTHPWTVMRAKELNKWVESNAYKNIISKQVVNSDIICKKCGNRLKETANFCSICGKKVE